MSTNVNLKLRDVLEAIYERHQQAEKDARQSARSLGAAKADAQTIGADAKRDAEHMEILRRHMQGVVDIAITIASMVMGGTNGSGGKGGGGGKGAAQGAGPKGNAAPKTSAAANTLHFLAQNTGLAGAVLGGAIEGAIEGGVKGAIEGALKGLAKWVKANLGLVTQLLAAQSTIEEREGMSDKQIQQLEELEWRAFLDATPQRLVPEVLNRALSRFGMDTREDAEAIDRLAQSLAQAEAMAKTRRAREQTELKKTERAILELRDVAALA